MIESILHTRHSARAFVDRPVDEAILREIIAEAQLAPSWCNSQPAKAYVATGETAKKLNQSHYLKNTTKAKSWGEVMPPQEDTWNPNNNENIGKFLAAAEVLEGQNDRLGFLAGNTSNFNAPVIVFITIPKNSTAYQAYDAGAFGYGVFLSAHVHGLSSIPAYEFVRFPEEIHEVFKIPENESILFGIGIGYPVDEKDAEINRFYKVNKRAPLDSILVVK